MKRLYLAGPEVFRREAAAIGRQMQALCAQYGFAGVFPLEAELETGVAPLSRRIYEANVAAIRACDGLIANLSPFRGPSADVGTAFEVGYAIALGKPVFAHASLDGSYAARVAQSHGPLREEEGRLFARDGMCVENFGLADNLMLVESLRAQGRDVSADFEACLREAAAHVARAR